MRFHKPSLGTILGATALAVSLGGVAVAAIPGSDGTIDGCYDPTNGPPFALTIVDTPVGCKSPSVLLPFNQQGPAGQTGATGPAGPAGPAGPSGEASAVYQAHNTTTSTLQDGGQLTVQLPLPPGAYAVFGRVGFVPTATASATCQLVARDAGGFHDADTVQVYSGYTHVPAPDPDIAGSLASGLHLSYDAHAVWFAPVDSAQVHAPLQTATTITTSGGVELTCRAQRFISNLQMRVMAIKLGSVASYSPTAADKSTLAVHPKLPAKPTYPKTIHLPPLINHLVHH